MNTGAFYEQGNTVLVAASSSTSQTPTQVSTAGISACHLSNPCTVTLYVSIGTSASAVAAAQPTTAVPCEGLCLPAGETRVVGLGPNPSNCWISAATSAGTAAPGLFATPGQLGL